MKPSVQQVGKVPLHMAITFCFRSALSIVSRILQLRKVLRVASILV